MEIGTQVPKDVWRQGHRYLRMYGDRDTGTKDVWRQGHRYLRMYGDRDTGT